ncbi:MAG: TolC family protein, partial [Desulfarculus sp.]|nr:TolC family protein [Desulfarculus sp.]
TQELSQAELRLARHQLIAQVKKLYYALSQGQATLEAAQQALVLHQEVARLSQDHYAKGLMLEAERLEVSARLAKAQYELQAQQANLAGLKEQLNHLLGRSPDHGFEPELVAEEAPVPKEDDPLAARPAPRQPETEAARQRLEVARRDLGYKQAERLPELSLVGSHVTQKNLPGLPENVSSVGLMLTWEPFDWGRDAREAAAKARTVRQAENQLEETQRQAALEVRQEARRVGLARRLLGAARLAVQAAQEKTRVVLNRFVLQAALVKDLTEAQASLAEAQRDYAQALAAFWSARADLEKAQGEDGP